MRLSLSMVVKNGLEDLKRLQPLVEPFIDEWVVVLPPKDKAISWARKNGLKVIVKDFTQPIEPELVEKMKEWGLEVPSDYHLFNFAAARNASLESATGYYVLWIDADDEPIGMDNIKKLIEKNPKIEVFNALYDYGKDEEGNSISDHYRERIVLNNGKWEWKGAKLGLIHETLMSKDDLFEPFALDVPEDVFRVEHHTDHVQESSMRNHIALLYEYLKTGGEDPRTTYYLGIEYFNRRMFEYCIKVLQEFVEVTGSDEDRHSAWLKIAEAYHMLEDRKSGRNAYLKAIDELPHKPDGYLGLGESYHEEEQWAKSNEYIMTGLQKKLPKGKHGLDVMKYTFRPSGYVALNYLQLGKQADAFEWFMRAAKMNPKHPWVQDSAQLFYDAKDLDDYVKSFVKLGQLSQRLYPKTLSKLADAVPDELKDQELLMDFKWRYTTPKIWSEKSIVFFCSSAFEDWGPESLDKGCGGSEEAVIQLTKRLVKLGWEVTIFNNCIKEGIIDGVRWVRFECFNPRDIFNILVGWRNNPFIDAKVAAKKYIDMHDVPTEMQYYTADALKGVKLLVKSGYHRNLFDLPEEQTVVIPNGVDLEQFKSPEKTKNNLVWTSSYDRGLQNLLEMWTDLKREVPDITLDCYYGFELYDTTPWGKKPSGQVWKRKMQQLLSQDGVTDHGRVGTDIVAKGYLKADVWAYPTAFPEISCLTAMKAQAAGAIPVCTDFAALKETVKSGVIIKGDINDPSVKEQFKTELILLLKDEPRKEELRKSLDASEFSWDVVSKAWDEELKS